jgi:multisubunit Na+/H+ antiporter MnhF subunit
MTLLTKGPLVFDSAFGFNVMYTVIKGIIIIIQIHRAECFFGS